MIWLIENWQIVASGVTIFAGMIALRVDWRLITGIVLVVGALIAARENGKDAVQSEWNAEKLQRAQEQVAAFTKLKKLEEQKNVNLAEIDRLRGNNHALWLRLPKTPCTGGLPNPGENTTAGGGQLPESGTSGAEEALNEYVRICADKAYQADRIVEDCRPLNQ